MAAKDKKGLGMGLDALFGGDSYDDEPTLEPVTVPIERVEPRSDQPREHFDQAALNELADSIARFGLIQPVIVRQLEGGYYQIIAGERRWRASRLAGLEEIPVRVIEADDRRTAELALVENLQREDLNPIEEAKGYKTLMEEYGLTQEETARSVGRSRPAVANALRLLHLSPQVLKLVEEGKLSAGHARAIVAIDGQELQLEAAKQIMEKELSVRSTERLAAKLAKAKPEKAEPEQSLIRVDYAKEVSDELTRLLGRRVRLTEGRKNGKIELEFYGADDRESLIELLRGIEGKRGGKENNA